MALERISRDRRMLLSGSIDSKSVGSLITSIFELGYDDKLKSAEFNNFEVKPIELYINSCGGSVYDGLALVDVIMSSFVPVHTYCVGSCQSMAFWIFLSGDQRYCGKNATFMYHEVSQWVGDKLEGLKLELVELERLQNSYDAFITSRTCITTDQLLDYRSRKAEWYMSSKEALDLKVCGFIL